MSSQSKPDLSKLPYAGDCISVEITGEKLKAADAFKRKLEEDVRTRLKAQYDDSADKMKTPEEVLRWILRDVLKVLVI